MDRRKFEEFGDLPEEIRLLYIKEAEARWKERKLRMTSGEPWADGIAAAFLSSIVAIPFLTFSGSNTENIGPGAVFFGVLAFFISRNRHKSYWRERTQIEEIEMQSFIKRANDGEFEHLNKKN